MNQKLSKLIRKYCKIMQKKDYRPVNGFCIVKPRPDYILKEHYKNMNYSQRIKFIKKMKEAVKNND